MELTDFETTVNYFKDYAIKHWQDVLTTFPREEFPNTSEVITMVEQIIELVDLSTIKQYLRARTVPE